MSAEAGTESGSEDFSRFYPAEDSGEVNVNLSELMLNDVGVCEGRTPLFSRKTKATSIILPESEEILLKPKLSPGRRRIAGKRKNHSSLPAELGYTFNDISSTSGFGNGIDNMTETEVVCSDAMSRIAAFRRELELLKGCVSERRTVFSPSTSPDFCFEDLESPKSRPPPLPVDEPFRILSSSDHVVFPMEEYSIHVPPLAYPEPELTDQSPDQSPDDLLEKIDHAFSNNDLDIPSDEFLDDQSHDEHLHVQPTSCSTLTRKFSRQGSLEYDHLEPDEEEDSSRRAGKLVDAETKTTNNKNSYFVTVQFHDLNDSKEAERKKDDKRKLSFSSVQEKILPDTEVQETGVGSEEPPSCCLSATRPYPNHLGGGCSSSIPDHLDTSSPQRIAGIKSHHPWSSAGHLHTIVTSQEEEESKPSCHCPVCCSCGSSHRQLPIGPCTLTGYKVSGASHHHQPSEDTLSNASCPACPIERYSGSTTKPSVRTGNHTPGIAVSQAISKKIEHTLSVNEKARDKGFGSSVEIAHSNSVIEDELEISSNYSNHALLDMDNQSVFSFHSLLSVQSGYTAHSCCSSHQPFNKGVEGSLFKERIEAISQWFNEFSDQQRNSMLLRLLSQSNCSQMHMLSVEMEPILHQCCPHNCQDLLSWLPPGIAFRILSFLDPVSLCRASRVSCAWYSMACDPLLWKQLTLSRNWQMSFEGHCKQLDVFTSDKGEIQWKLMFAERFRLRRNWLKGFCTVRTFEGHSQGISCVQFDDTRIVSGSWDKTIKVWNRRTNTAWAALTLAGHSGTVRCLHLHGNRLVSGSSDRTIKVWDLATHNVNWVGAACKATMVGHLHTVRCLKADDTKVVSGSYDHTLKIWDIKTGTCTKTLRGHTDAVLCLQFDSEKVVSGSKDTTIKVWEFKNGRCKLTLHGHEGAVSCLQFDDNRIVSGALDRLIKIWNLNTGQCVRTIDWIKSEGHTGVVRHLQADSWKIVSAADDKTLKVWSVQSGERLLTLRSHSDGVTCLQFNDQVIVSGSYDKTVKLWDFSVC